MKKRNVRSYNEFESATTPKFPIACIWHAMKDECVLMAENPSDIPREAVDECAQCIDADDCPLLLDDNVGETIKVMNTIRDRLIVLA